MNANMFRQLNAPQRCVSRTRRLFALAALLAALLLPEWPALADVAEYQAAIGAARELPRTSEILEVVRAYEHAAELAPGDEEKARAWFELGTHLERRRESKMVYQVFSKILALDPPTTWHGSVMERLARLHQRAGNLAEAVRYFEAMAGLEGSPSAAQRGLYGLIDIHQQMGQIAEAKAAAERLRRDYPESHYARLAAGALVEGMIAAGDLAGAKRLAEAEAASAGGNASLLLRVATTASAGGDRKTAVELAEKYVALQPESPQGYEVLYQIHRQQGTVAQYAERLKRQAAEPNNPGAPLRRLADLYEREGQFAEAFGAYEKLIAGSEPDADLLAKAGQMAVRTGKRQPALAYYRRAIEMNPDNQRLAVEMGSLQSEMGEREAAIETWRTAYKYDPQDPGTARSLGRQYHIAGYYQDAVAVYLECREATGTPHELATELGDEYAALLRIDDAVREYLLAMAAQPGLAQSARRRLQVLAADEAAGPDVIAALENRRQGAGLPLAGQISLAVAYGQGGRWEAAKAALAELEQTRGVGMLLVQIAAEIQETGKESVALMLYSAATGMPLAGELSAHVALRVADAHTEAGRWQSALASLERVDLGQLAPDLANRLRVEMGDLLVLRAGRFEDAARLYAPVAELAANLDLAERAAWGLADCAFVAGKYDDAAAGYRELMGRSSPMDSGLPVEGPPPAPFDMGGPFQMANPFMLTEPSRERPMGVDYGRFQLAEIEFREGHFAEAKKQFNALVADSPGSPYANDALQRVLMLSSEFVGESPAEGKYLQGLVAADRGEVEEAAKSLTLIFSLGSEELLADDAKLLHADTLSRFAREEDALAEYQSLVAEFEDSPLAPEALLRAARLAARMENRHEDAVKLFQQVRREHPGSPQAAQAELALEEIVGR